MPEKCATKVDATSISKQLTAALGEAQVLQIARECRWLRRLRDITPLALVVACLSTLGASKATWIADILRTFNAFTGLSIRYKPFHNQLRKAAFPEFMRRLLERTLEKMTRLRWQIELLFKECKSHANLHRFDTEKSEIAEGLIWASRLVVVLKRAITHAAQLAIGIELSTQRAASCAKHVLDDILRCLLSNVPELAGAVDRACVFLGVNSRRAHPARDRQRGRLSSGLIPLVTG
jgi:hypothetical protein